MNLPPLLLAATLIFWGWQTGFLTVGALLAVVFEGTRLTRFQWDASEDELNRLWNLVTVIFLAAAVFAFSSNEGPLAFAQMFENPGFSTSRAAGDSSQRTAASLIQWMPMIFFPFLLAVALSRQNTVTLKVLSLVARRPRPGRAWPQLANHEIHIGWIYFSVCLVASSINNRGDAGFFAGLACLLVWALWTRRSRRFPLPVWGCVAGAACLLAYWGQGQMGELRIFLEHYTPQWGWRVGGGRTNPDQDRTSIGQIGRLKGSGRVVVRLEPEEGTIVPSLMRMASYRFFRSPFWMAENSRRGGAGADRFETLSSHTRAGDWFLRTSLSEQRIRIATYLEGGSGLLPLPMGVSRLENLQVFFLRTNILGAVLAQGPDLVVFNADFGRDGSIDSAPTDDDLQVPPAELAAVEAAVAEAVRDRRDTASALRSIRGFFEDKFQYSLWQNIRFRRDEAITPLARFLLNDRKGHCEYFATATVLMLRKLGIPARYAVGWAVEEPSGGGYVIRERHAHAWCIYYDAADAQWHEFDTTPASWVGEENARASMFEFLTDIWQRIKFEFTKWRSGQSHFRDYLWWIIGPMLLFLLYRLLRRKPRERGKAVRADDRLPVRLGLDSEFYRVEKKLGELGFVRPPGETQAQFVERAVRDARVACLHDVMFAMIRAHYRLRFDPLGLAQEEREALALRVRDAMERLDRLQAR